MNLDYSPAPDERGNPAGVIAIVVETTARVLAERRQAAERERQRTIFQQMPGFVGVLRALITSSSTSMTLMSPFRVHEHSSEEACARCFRNLKGRASTSFLTGSMRLGNPLGRRPWRSGSSGK